MFSRLSRTTKASLGAYKYQLKKFHQTAEKLAELKRFYRILPNGSPGNSSVENGGGNVVFVENGKAELAVANEDEENGGGQNNDGEVEILLENGRPQTSSVAKMEEVDEDVALIPDEARDKIRALEEKVHRLEPLARKALLNWELCASRYLHFLGELAIRSLTYLEDTFATQMKEALKKVGFLNTNPFFWILVR
jgi:hypothetical protein